jgi:hypothetical protein
MPVVKLYNECTRCQNMSNVYKPEFVLVLFGAEFGQFLVRHKYRSLERLHEFCSSVCSVPFSNVSYVLFSLMKVLSVQVFTSKVYSWL